MTKPAFSAFTRVQQSSRDDDVFAVVGMLCGMSLAEVFKQAEVFGMPTTGPVFPWGMDASFVAQLLMSRSLVGGQWKECDSFMALPDVALAMVDFLPSKDCGRVVLFHRLPENHPSGVKSYVVDPYPHSQTALHYRQDLSGLNPAWFIAVSQIAAPAATATPKAKGK